MLKQLLLSLHGQVSVNIEEMRLKDEQIEHLREQNVLLLQRLFGSKSEQTVDPDTPLLPLLNEAEALIVDAPEAATNAGHTARR